MLENEVSSVATISDFIRLSIAKFPPVGLIELSRRLLEVYKLLEDDGVSLMSPVSALDEEKDLEASSEIIVNEDANPIPKPVTKRSYTRRSKQNSSVLVSQIVQLKAAGLSQKAISERVGVSQPTVSKILRNAKPEEAVPADDVIEVEENNTDAD